MHKAYEDAMNRKAHRHALLKAAKESGVVNWQYTKNNWTVLKAGDTGDTMFVSVCIEVQKDIYLKHKEQYERAQAARTAKAAKEA